MAKPTDAKAPKARRIPTVLIAIVALAIIGGILWLLFKPGSRKPEDLYTGYVVSDNVYMSSPVSGTLASVSVKRGQRVNAGDPLFKVDPTVRQAETDRAQGQIDAAQAQVAQQEAMLTQAKADLAGAQADAEKAATQLNRLLSAQKEKAGSVAQTDIDQAKAALQAAVSKRDAAKAQIASAGSAIDAARAQVIQAQAGLTTADRQLNDLAPVAPSAGRIDDITYKPGESVTANTPVVSIVPDGEVKVRFYVPEAQVSAFKPGRKVQIACDGCATGMTAVVDFVANRPEYTPPIIYSLDSRQKLVFMVEAVPSSPEKLIPGQPMDVAGAASGLPKK